MAFDVISGTISIVSILLIIVVCTALYMNLQTSKKIFSTQLDDLIKQINASQVYIYNLTKQQNKDQSDIIQSLKQQEQTQADIQKNLQNLSSSTSCIKCPKSFL